MEQIHHNNPVTPVSLFMMILSLVFAGIGTILRDLHTWLVPGLALHYALVIAQGICYLVSIIVGGITVYKFLKERRKNGHK